MNISISLKMPARYFRAAFIVDLLDAARVPTPRVPDYGREPELNERGRPGDQKQAQGILIAALGMRDGTRKATPAHARIPAAIANARRHVTRL